MPNHLVNENSPYLLQHAENPVEWYPWGPAALERAKSEGKPVFLSIGYSACHWCHVMAHESFEDSDIAQILRERFISIKVDREERPDLDHLYMEAVQMMTGHGGWPLSVFLTPDLEPFFGGTYWPRHQQKGMPGFDQVLLAVSDAWQRQRQEMRDQARRLSHLMKESLKSDRETTASALGDEPLAVAEEDLRRSFDPVHGGFGPAPKFPPSLSLPLLLRRWRRSGDAGLLDMVCTTLDRMAAGGIHDQLGGGFHRYSVDERWLVPHFEKMLYDNALLAECYLEAWQATGREDYARVARQTLDYVLRDMTDPQGGFYGAEDADSEGQEGCFYLWTPEEIEAVLGSRRAAAFCHHYHASRSGNFEGRNILHGPPHYEPADELAADRAKLLAVRNHRVRPARDDKILVAWNGLMIHTLARCGAAMAEPRYVEAAARAAAFLLEQVRGPQGRLARYWRRGQAKGEAYLDDYAALANALVSLYEARFEERWIEEAVTLADQILHRFIDADHGGFFYADPSVEHLPVRKKDVFDSSAPSSTGMAAMALLRLGKLCQRADCVRAAERALAANWSLIQRAPTAMAQMLLALDFSLGPVRQIVVLASAGCPGEGVFGELHRRFLPNKVVALRREGQPTEDRRSELADLFGGKQIQGSGPTLFVCDESGCQASVSGQASVAAALAGLANSPG